MAIAVGTVTFSLVLGLTGRGTSRTSQAGQPCPLPVADTGRTGRESTIISLSGLDCPAASVIVREYMEAYQQSTYNIIEHVETVRGWSCSYPKSFPATKPMCQTAEGHITWSPVDTHPASPSADVASGDGSPRSASDAEKKAMIAKSGLSSAHQPGLCIEAIVTSDGSWGKLSAHACPGDDRAKRMIQSQEYAMHKGGSGVWTQSWSPAGGTPGCKVPTPQREQLGFGPSSICS